MAWIPPHKRDNWMSPWSQESRSPSPDRTPTLPPTPPSTPPLGQVLEWRSRASPVSDSAGPPSQSLRRSSPRRACVFREGDIAYLLPSVGADSVVRQDKRLIGNDGFFDHPAVVLQMEGKYAMICMVTSFHGNHINDKYYAGAKEQRKRYLPIRQGGYEPHDGVQGLNLADPEARTRKPSYVNIEKSYWIESHQLSIYTGSSTSRAKISLDKASLAFLRETVPEPPERPDE